MGSGLLMIVTDCYDDDAWIVLELKPAPFAFGWTND